MPGEKTRLVYSTDKTVSRKEQTGEESLPPDVRPSQQRVIVRLDRKSRGGKSVTVIEGLLLAEQERGELLKKLKEGFGTGGTDKGGVLEIQGDHRDSLITVLEKMGYRPKCSGG